MPRVDHVRYTITRADSSDPETWKSEAGTTLSEVLNDELCVNPAKFSVYLNGAQVSDLDREVHEGDNIWLQPRNYSSGS